MKSILPPTYFNAALAASLILHFAVPVAVVVRFPLNLLGILPVLLGAFLNVGADALFKKTNTTVKPFQRPSAFIAGGPFAWCRHPMYLGMTAILAGAAIICGSLTSLVGPLAFWVVVRLRFIPAEERLMIETFGDRYREYKRRVRSWI